MPRQPSVEDLVLNYDPEFPQARFQAAGIEAALRSSTGRLPSPVPWPESAKPVPQPLPKAPPETADLTRFRNYEAIIVTWTAAEAAALAALMTPDYLPSRWYEYRHNIKHYIPLVTGRTAPFNDKAPDMARYYQSLGLYFPCQIGKARVLLFKSGLHLDYDGPATPIRELVGELMDAVRPKLFITTGTGGGIGSDVKLGDVVIAEVVRFDCTTQFRNESWATASFKTSPLPKGALDAIAPDLTKINAARIEGARPTPMIWSANGDAIVTTDFFGFDDSTNHYHLQGLGQACDMGDAMVGYALQQYPDVQWHAIRNASDPQIPDPTGDIQAAKKQAGTIYAKYGAFTTAASVIASWAVVDATFNRQAGGTFMPARRRAQSAKARAAAPASHPLLRLMVRRASGHGGYGWVRDLPDARDFAYAAPLFRFPQGLPTSVDLRSDCPPIYDQGQLGSCTGNGIAGAIEFDQRKQGNKVFIPSRLFIYYNERVMENTVNQDVGAQVRDGIKSVATLGAPPETDWPYNIAKFADRPPMKAYTDAKQDLVSTYSRVNQDLMQMRGCLAEGYPFVFGFTVYESFESQQVASTGVVPMPQSGEKIVGGHCVVAVGYDDNRRVFIIRNSWGTGWGMKGYCTMPYEYLQSSHFSSDFWTIRSVAG